MLFFNSESLIILQAPLLPVGLFQLWALCFFFLLYQTHWCQNGPQFQPIHLDRHVHLLQWLLWSFSLWRSEDSQKCFWLLCFQKRCFREFMIQSLFPPHCLCCFGMSDLWRVLINNYKKNLTQQLPVNVNTWVSCCSALKHHIFYLLDSFIQVICKCAKIHINTKYQYQYWIMILSRKNTDHHKIRIRSPGQMTMWVWVSTPPPGFKLNLNNVHSQWKFVCLQL